MVSAPMTINRVLVCEIRLGTKMQMALESKMGMAANFLPLRKYFSPSAPKRAGTTCSNAGVRVGLSKMGCRGCISNTPTASTATVTKELVATERVEIISFSGGANAGVCNVARIDGAGDF